MATARSTRSDVSKQILEHATRLFAAHGFVGASLRDIAKAVGIRKPSLLYHYPSKDELRRRVLEQMLAHWNETVPRLLKAATSGQEQFEAIATETVNFFVADPDRARLLLREMLDRPDEMRPLVEAHVQPWTKIMCDYITKGREQGRVHADIDPEIYVAHMINLVVCGVAMLDTFAALTPGGGAPDQHAATQRHVKELLRVARAALFIDPALRLDAEFESPSSPSK
ncbi:MAG: TetR/AcrR family transcriptional regulator [Nannocystaceae bacterium]|nr:TetR/AcrR family transcriptional regulator [Nannocystaceae bacterium]